MRICFKELAFAAGSVLDRWEVNRGLENILQKYKENGYYYAEVTLDERALRSEARVIYHIIEGPRVRVRKILLEGVHAFATPRPAAQDSHQDAPLDSAPRCAGRGPG